MKKIVCILLVLLMALSVFSLTGCFESKFIWNEIVLREQLPEPNTDIGECKSNTEERLYLEVEEQSETSYSAYVQACKDKGFSIDPKTIGDNYDAYNAEGYKLSLSSISGAICIELVAPMKVAQITWPTADYAGVIPVPVSTMGKIGYENSEGFSIYIANTTVDEYNAYVQACMEKGFNVDYSKSEHSYRAKNGEGYSLSLSYEGFNIICIDLHCPAKTFETESSDNVSGDSVVSDSSEDVLGSDFKAAMDSYEQFMDEYISFMKKYKENPGNVSLLSDYASFMSKYNDFVRDFEKWKDKDLNSAELAYYMQVQARVSQKLLEVAQ